MSGSQRPCHAPRKRRQRGHIGQLPSGAYRVRVYAGTDALTGRPRQLCETVSTYAEATRTLTRLQDQVDEDTDPKSDITVGQAVERWLEVVVLEDAGLEVTFCRRLCFPENRFIQPSSPHVLGTARRR
jgi:hypothetical protein